MIDLEQLLTYLTLISVPVGVFYHIMTLRNTRRNQELPLETRQAQLYMTLFNAIYNQEIWGHVNEIRNYSFTDYDDFIEKYGPVSNPEAYAKINKVFWLFTEMGSLVYRGYITLRDVGDLMGATPIEVWRKWGPIIEGLRANIFSSKSGHLSFEYLAKNLLELRESGAWELYLEQMKQAIPDIEIR